MVKCVYSTINNDAIMMISELNPHYIGNEKKGPSWSIEKSVFKGYNYLQDDLFLQTGDLPLNFSCKPCH